MTGPVQLVKKWPCLMLLVVQLAGVVLYPFMAGSYAGRAAFAVFGLLVLSLTVSALRVTPTLTWVGVLFALPCAGLLLASIVTGNQQLFPWSAGFEMVLYAYAAFSMLAYMLRDDHVSTDEWFAIPAVFTLLAWAFAYLFVVVQALDTGAFGGHRDWMGLLFLSFTTLSSTGLSNIVPITGHARSVVMLEQICGVFYVAMVVTRLVSVSVGRRRS